MCHDVCFFGPDVGPSNTPYYTFADSTTNFCVQKCPQYYYADNITVAC